VFRAGCRPDVVHALCHVVLFSVRKSVFRVRLRPEIGLPTRITIFRAGFRPDFGFPGRISAVGRFSGAGLRPVATLILHSTTSGPEIGFRFQISARNRSPGMDFGRALSYVTQYCFRAGTRSPGSKPVFRIRFRREIGPPGSIASGHKSVFRASERAINISEILNAE
jgi:hypothetical protein